MIEKTEFRHYTDKFGIEWFAWWKSYHADADEEKEERREARKDAADQR